MLIKLLKKLLGLKTRGDQILENEKNNVDFDLCAVITSVRNQGATDNDIKTWWDMSNEEMNTIRYNDHCYKLAFVKSAMQKGGTYEDAVENLKKSLPTYDIYKPGDLHGIDDPLPYEIKRRVNKYFIKNVLNKTPINKELHDFTSMNALIRHKIKIGEI